MQPERTIAGSARPWRSAPVVPPETVTVGVVVAVIEVSQALRGRLAATSRSACAQSKRAAASCLTVSTRFWRIDANLV